jgi:filamentous hemagglutinin family protein
MLTLERAIALTLLCGLFVSPAFAEIVPDSTLPQGSVVNPMDRVLAIAGGTQSGTTLFHSFKDFSIPSGQTVLFFPNAAIQNMIVRVTSGERSRIDGTLAVNGNANLFLMNPNGITFGQNAKLSINGSFIATTAEQVKFADGSVFSTTQSQVPLLTVSVPIGVQFRLKAGSIVNQAQLSAREIALLGGDLQLQGAIATPGGNILLTSAATPGFVELTGNTDIQKFGAVTVSGTVAAEGGKLQILGGEVSLRDRALISSDTRGSINGQGITIQAERLSLQNRSTIQTVTTAVLQNPGKAGDIEISARQIQLEGGSLIETTSGTLVGNRVLGGSGASGNLTLNAIDEIRLEGFGLDRNTASILSTTTFGSGNAGNLSLNSRRLVSLGQSLIVANTFGSGEGGTVTIRASESVQIGGSQGDAFGIGTSSGKLVFQRFLGLPPATGAAGDIKIFTPQLSIQDQGAISVGSVGNGNAGTVQVQSSLIKLDNGIINAENNSGGKGEIELRSQLILLRNGSRITTNAGNSDGGNIRINTGVLAAISQENSDITANAAGRGGNIEVITQGILGLRSRPSLTPNSDITATGRIKGDITLKTFNTEPKDITELPSSLVQIGSQITPSCAALAQQNSFVQTGRGGLEANVSEASQLTPIWMDPRSESQPGRRDPLTNSPLLPARGWLIQPNGIVTLVANSPSRQAESRCAMSKDLRRWN